MKWIETTVSDVAIVNPKLDRSKFSDPNVLVSFVPMAGVSEETASIRSAEDKPYSEVSKGFTSFQRGDVLVAKITPCFENGKIAIADQLPRVYGFGSTEFHVLRPKGDLDGSYLYHLIRNPNVRVAGEYKMKGAAGQRRVPADFLGKLKIPLPPLEEQKRIAKILDAADALRAKRRQAIAQLDTFLQSTFLDLFGDPVTNPKGWDTLELSEVTDILTGYAFKSALFLDREQGIRLCRGINIGLGQTNWKDRVDWDKSEFDHYEKFKICQGDVLLAMDRPWINGGLKIAVATEHDIPSLLVQRVARIRCSKLLRPIIYNLINNDYFTQHCNPTETTVPHISPKDLKSFKVITPPLELQQRFASIVESVEQQKSKMQAHLTQLDTLFASLQQRAFKGEL